MFEAAGDDLALYIAYTALGARWRTCAGRWTRRWRPTSGPLAHARRAGHSRRASLGRAPVVASSARHPCRSCWRGSTSTSHAQGGTTVLRAFRAGALAMLGRFDEARAILAETRAELAERGGGVQLANITAFESVGVELLAGDPAAAAEFGAEGCRLFEELGEQGFLSTAAGKLARALYALDRLDEADAWAGRAAELGASDDAWTEMLWRQARPRCSRAAASTPRRSGSPVRRSRSARDGLLDAQGDAYADLAEVLLLAGKPDEAVAALEQALERYERKEQPRLGSAHAGATRRAPESSPR